MALLLLAAACGSPATEPDPPPVQVPQETALLDVAPAGSLPSTVLGGRNMEARAVDVDADGDPDLVVAREFERNRLLVNDGGGRFTDESDARLPALVQDHEDIAVGDFDGDGDPDLVVVSEDDLPPGAGSTGGRKQELYLNDGRGVFTDARDRLPAGASESNAVAAGDIDRDGDLDLVVSDRGREIAWINDGRGRFTDESTARFPQAPDVTQDVALGDVDGDGDLDLVVANDQGPNQLLLNEGRGVFSAAPAGRLSLRGTCEVTRNADLGDVDGDRDLDLYFANATYGCADGQDRLLLNDGRGSFSDATDRLPRETQSTFDADLVDIDGDGDLDVVTASTPASAQYQAYLNDGTGRFTDGTARVFPAAARVGDGIEIEAADFNGDRRVDLYLATFINSPSRLLLAR